MISVLVGSSVTAENLERFPGHLIYWLLADGSVSLLVPGLRTGRISSGSTLVSGHLRVVRCGVTRG